MTEAVTAAPAPIVPDQIPAELKALPQWVCWSGKKIPLCPATGTGASSTDPATWGTFTEAMQAYERNHFQGIGFVFSENDPYVGVDYDHIVDGPEWQPGIWQEVQQFSSYTEYSPSGTGVHVILKGKIPGPRNRSGQREMYEKGRYFTFTGRRVPGTPAEITENQEALERVYQLIDAKGPDVEETACNGGDPNLSDEDILAKCRSAKNKDKFLSLFAGDATGYYSNSEADMALCSILSFYSQDEAQIDRIFRTSQLFRPKWDELRGTDTYGEITVRSAIRHNSTSYTKPKCNTSESLPACGHAGGRGFTLTDVGNSDRLFLLFGQNILHCQKLNAWFTWNGKFWERDFMNRVMDFATQTAKSIYFEAADTGEENLGKWAVSSQGISRRVAMLEGIKHMVPMLPENFDEANHLLNCLNGTLDLDTMNFREHRREDLLTKVAGVDYNPAATCQMWEKHIDLVFQGDPDLIECFQELCGYALAGGNPDQVIFILYGRGKNGKNVSIDTIAQILGDYAEYLPAEGLIQQRRGSGARPDLVRLAGARFVPASELPKNAKLDETVVKQLTGDEVIPARGLYENLRDIKRSFVIFLATNAKPEINGTDEGIWRRIWLIPFTYTIPEDKRVQDFTEVILRAGEGPGILNWSLTGYRRYVDRGRLLQPEAVKAATSRYRNDSDLIGQWFREEMIFDPSGSINRAEARDSYTTWVRNIGEEPIDARTLAQELQDRFRAEAKKSNGINIWKRIRCMTPEEKKW